MGFVRKLVICHLISTFFHYFKRMLGYEEDATCHDDEGKDLEEDTEEATNFKVETQATFL